MGLDITYYSKVERLRPITPNESIDYDRLDREDWIHLYNLPAFADRADDLGTPIAHGDTVSYGIFRAHDPKRFRAGSYGGYNRWREHLSRLALDAEPRTVWDNVDEHEGKPCFEIIHFADNEGTLGPRVCAKLAEDFEAIRPKAAEQDEWFLQVFDHFLEAFRAARDGGAVDFG